MNTIKFPLLTRLFHHSSQALTLNLKVGQASRLPDERVSASSASASPTRAGETPALLLPEAKVHDVKARTFVGGKPTRFGRSFRHPFAGLLVLGMFRASAADIWVTNKTQFTSAMAVVQRGTTLSGPTAHTII